MKIIDFDIKGNVIKFYLGQDNDMNYHGDDWDDVPYEHNAGEVYSEFVEGYAYVYLEYELNPSYPQVISNISVRSLNGVVFFLILSI